MRYIVYLIFFILGAVVTLLLKVPLPDNFYNFNLVQLIMPLLQILVLVAIAIFVNVKLSNQDSKNSIIIEMLDAYKERVTDLDKIASEYMYTKNSDLERKILTLLTIANQDISVFKEIVRTKTYYPADDMEVDLREYKKRLTEKSFKQKQDYEPMQIKSVNSAKTTIIKKIIKAKIELYH